MTIQRGIALLSLAVLAGCGLLSQSDVPRECGLDDAEIAWVGTASLTELDLQDVTHADPTFPDDRRGDVYVTEPDPQGHRTFCIQFDAGTNDMSTHSGLAPAGWDPPSN